MNFLTISLEKKCRICATDIFDGASGISIFSDVYLEEKIKKYLYINLSPTDELPKIICGSCFIKLEGIHRFACLALKTEENYLTYLSRKKYNEENDQIDQKPLLEDLKIPSLTKIKTSRKENFKTVTKPYRQPKIRNTRHVDHITLEQIINDKIAKNFRSQNCEIIPVKNPLLSLNKKDFLATVATEGGGGTTIELTTPIKTTKGKSKKLAATITPSRVATASLISSAETLAKIKNEISILPYDDLKLGQYIKDQAVLCLILKSMKWDNAAAIINDSQMQKLKNTSFREVLANKNLLEDTDLVELLRTYIGQDTFQNIQNNAKLNGGCSLVKEEKEDLDETVEPVDLSIVYSSSNNKSQKNNGSDRNNNSNDDDSITQLEVKVDPELFLYDDDDNSSKANDSKSEDVKVFKQEFDDSYTVHITPKVQTKQRKFLCTICPDKFVSNVDLQEHIITHLMKPRDKLTCTTTASNGLSIMSSTNVSTTKSLSKLPTTNNGKVVKMKSRNKRRDKEEKKSKNDPNFECLICQKNLSTKGNLKTHMEIHRPRIKYSCDVCGKIFKSLINLVRHREYHNRFHRCPFCDKIYKNYADLKLHLNDHEDARPYQCPYCAKQFTNSGTFISHKKRVHAEEILNNDLVVH